MNRRTFGDGIRSSEVMDEFDADFDEKDDSEGEGDGEEVRVSVEGGGCWVVVVRGGG